MNCGDAMQLTKESTNELLRERVIAAIVAQIARYRLTTFAALERLTEFAEQGPGAVRRLLHETERRRLIANAPLHAGLRYWYLLPAGAELAGVKSDRTGPLTESAKLRAFALLQFCLLEKVRRERLTTEELSRYFPELTRPGLPGTYYFDPVAGRLGLARLDVGRCGRWDRIVKSVAADVAEHLAYIGFHRLADAGRFEITVLTALRCKANRLETALASLLHRRLPLRVVALPELLPLIVTSR